jgi:Rrf2 family protein
MLVSTKGRYAIKVMTDLAEHYGQGYISLQDIADRQEISEKYLENIIRSLVADNLLEGQRGKGGGYKLTKSPEEYTLGRILRLTEGSLSPVSCMTESGQCEKVDNCNSMKVWQEADRIINEYFDSVKLSSMLE